MARVRIGLLLVIAWLCLLGVSLAQQVNCVQQCGEPTVIWGSALAPNLQYDQGDCLNCDGTQGANGGWCQSNFPLNTPCGPTGLVLAYRFAQVTPGCSNVNAAFMQQGIVNDQGNWQRSRTLYQCQPRIS